MAVVGKRGALKLSYEDILRQVPLFSKLSDDDLHELASSSEVAAIPGGEFMVKQGDEGDSVYAIITGRANVVVTDQSGREGVIATLGPRDFFGEMSLLDNQPRSASVQALEPCQILRLKKRRFLNLLAKSHSMAMVIIDDLVRRLRDADRQIKVLSRSTDK